MGWAWIHKKVIQRQIKRKWQICFISLLNTFFLKANILSRIIHYVWKDLFDYKNYNYHIFLWKFQFLIGFCTSFESTKLSYLIGLPCIGSIISIICFLLRTSIQLILLNHAWLLISLAPLTPNLLLEFESSNYINQNIYLLN